MTPSELPPKWLRRFRTIEGRRRAVYAAIEAERLVRELDADIVPILERFRRDLGPDARIVRLLEASLRRHRRRW